MALLDEAGEAQRCGKERQHSPGEPSHRKVDASMSPEIFGSAVRLDSTSRQLMPVLAAKTFERGDGRTCT